MSTKKSIAIGFIFALIILTPLFTIFHSKFPNKPALKGEIISGKIDLNGYVSDKNYIEIGERERDADKFTIIAQNLPAVDSALWYWVGSQKNKNYELQAYLKQDNKTISQSGIITVTAPAVDEVLTINSKAENSPLPSVAPTPGGAKEGRRAMIAGVVDLNGHVPNGSVIEIVQRIVGEPSFQEAVSDIPATDSTAWVWKGAKEGTEYEIQAYIKNLGVTLGESQVLKVTAPALNEVLVINSIATPPIPTKSAISGKINLNGSLPQGNDTIVIYQRVQGTDKFEVAQDSIPPSDSALFSWGNADSGTIYEFIAVLKQNVGKDIATSSMLTVTAPAQNEIFNLNTGLTQPPPPNTPSVKCGTQTSIGQWNVTMSVSPYNNAQEYLLQIGSSSGGSDVLSSKVDLSGNIQASSVINNNTPYYARYAYAFCTNCPYNSFSAFSPVLTFACPPLPPTPAPVTPAPTPKPTLPPTPEPTTAPTAPPTPTNEPTTPPLINFVP